MDKELTVGKEFTIDKGLTMRRTSLTGLIPLLLLLATGEATAHASLDRAEPRVGNTVATAPREVTLWFTQKLEPAFSTITVTNPAGQRVDTGKPRVNGNQMAVSLRSGGAGTYRVNWRVLSVDTHTTDGNFSFQVGP
jgi:methionine-rich copper-binding protein CopC